MELLTTQTFINLELLEAFDVQAFVDRSPFPWWNFETFLTQEGFETLRRSFPPLELFEKHTDIQRAYGQRPHNRYYLAYENSIYHEQKLTDKGIIKHKELPIAWQRFIDELETNSSYQTFMKKLFGVSDYCLRYAWHVGFTGSEVSPHVDSPDKIGTHILYFNTGEDWNPAWGGSTLILDGKTTDALNPNISDFETVIPMQTIDNRSLLFKTVPDGWHAVEALKSPEGAYRRLFNIIFEFPKEQPSPGARLRSLVKKVVHR